MAKASDPRLTDITKKRPSSAPKPGDIAEIPKIILSERKETYPQIPSSLSSSLYSGAFSTSGVVPNPRYIEEKEIGGNILGAGSQGQLAGSHVPSRSSSDIGLPATSMPNLAAPLFTGSDLGISETYLEVFCSPRTFRRSVDLDINSKEHARAHFDWGESTDSSSNSLKVLTSTSRVGSALSLTSECTARSIGLLSNDSDSENDMSLTESEKLSIKPSHLRRFMSYPEDAASNEVCTRPSQSMSDIKTVDNTNVDLSRTSTIVPSLPETIEVELDRLDAVYEACKSGSPKSGRVSDERSSSPNDRHLQEKKVRTHKKEICKDRNRGGTTRPTHLLSYKCDTNDTARDGRIRQWLQDMDTQN